MTVSIFILYPLSSFVYTHTHTLLPHENYILLALKEGLVHMCACMCGVCNASEIVQSKEIHIAALSRCSKCYIRGHRDHGTRIRSCLTKRANIGISQKN